MVKILVVDDIPEYLDIFEIMLPDEYIVDRALSLEEAMNKIENSPPDIAIVDVRLNEEDEANKEGLELLRWIKKNYPEIAVIMISAYKEFEFRVESLENGAEYFIEKPVNPQVIVERIKEILEKKK